MSSYSNRGDWTIVQSLFCTLGIIPPQNSLTLGKITKMNKQKATLLLADGTVFHGTLIGKSGTNGGEICFNTGMTGYQEIYTDPSYTGQIIVTTTSHIGNYGVIDSEVESDHPTLVELW